MNPVQNAIIINLPKPTSRIYPVSRDGLIGETISSDIYFSNTSSDPSSLGFKGVADIFIQKGLVNLDNTNYIGILTFTLDSNSNPIPNTGKWIDHNGNILTSHPYASSGLTVPSDPNETNCMCQYRWYLYDSIYSSYGSDQPEFIIKSLSLQIDDNDGADINTNYYIKFSIFIF